MARMSSEESLNNILNILDYMVILDIEREQERKKEKENRPDIGKADKNLIQLMQGIVETVAKDPSTTAGAQLEMLSKGINNFKTIDTDSILQVTSTISTLGQTLNGLIIKDKALTSLNTLIEFLLATGLVNKHSIDNITYLSNLISPQVIKNINDSLNALAINKSVVNSVNMLTTILDNIFKINLSGVNNLKHISDNVSIDIIKNINDSFNVLAINKSVIDSVNNLSILLEHLNNINLSGIQELKQISIDDIKNINDSLNALAINKSVVNSVNMLATVLDNMFKMNLSGVNNLKHIVDNISVNSIKNINDSLNALAINKSVIDSVNILTTILGNTFKMNLTVIQELKHISDNISIDDIKNINDSLNALAINKSVIDSVNMLATILDNIFKMNLSGIQELKHISDNITVNSIKNINDSLNELALNTSVIDSVNILTTILDNIFKINLSGVNNLKYISDNISIDDIKNINDSLNALAINKSIVNSAKNLSILLEHLDNINLSVVNNLKQISDIISIDTIKAINDSFNALAINKSAIDSVNNLSILLEGLDDITFSAVNNLKHISDNISIDTIKAINDSFNALAINKSANISIDTIKNIMDSFNVLDINKTAIDSVNILTTILDSVFKMNSSAVNSLKHISDNISIDTIKNINDSFNALAINKSVIDSVNMLATILDSMFKMNSSAVNNLKHISDNVSIDIIKNINDVFKNLSINKSVVNSANNLSVLLEHLNNINSSAVNSLKYISDNISIDTIKNINDSVNALAINKSAIDSVNNLSILLKYLDNINPNTIKVLSTLSNNISNNTILNIITSFESFIISRTPILSLQNVTDFLNALSEINERNVIVSDFSDFIIALTNVEKQLTDIDTTTLEETLTHIINAFAAIDKINVDNISKLHEVSKIISIDDVNNILDYIKSFNIDTAINLDNINQFGQDINHVLDIFTILTTHLQDINDIIEESKSSLFLIGAFIGSLNILAEIDMSRLSDNISKLNVSDAENIGKFVKAIINSMPKEKEYSTNLAALGMFMNGLSKIFEVNLAKIKFTLNPIKGWLLGKSIGNFLSAIIKGISKNKIEADFKGLGELLQGLAVFANKKSDISIWTLELAFSKRRGSNIGAFFKEIIEAVPNTKESSAIAKNIGELLKALTGIKKTHILNIKFMSSVLNKKTGEKINEFITSLCKGVDPKALKSTTEALRQLPITLLLLVASVAIVATMLVVFGVETILGSLIITGAIIAGLHLIMKRLGGIKNKQILAASKAAMNIGFTIAILVATIALTALIITLFDVGTIIGAMAVVGAFLGGMTFIISQLANKKFSANVFNASKSLLMLAATVAIIVGLVLVVMIALQYIEQIQWGVMFGFLLSFATVIGGIYLLSKMVTEGAKDMLYMATSVSMILLTLTISLIAVTMLIDNYGANKIFGAILTVVALSALTIGILLILSKMDGTIKEGSMAMLAITGFYLLTTLTLMLLSNIENMWDKAVPGMMIVLGVTAVSILLLKLLAYAVKKDLVPAIISLAGIAFIMLGISLMIKELFVPIGKLWAESAKGAIVVLGVVSISIMLLKWLAGGKDGGINRIKEIGLATLILAGIAVILIGISLMIKELFIPIGQQWAEAAKGVAVVGGVIVTMGGILLALKLFAKIGRSSLVDIAIAEALLGGLAAVLTLCTAPVFAFIKLAKAIELGPDGKYYAYAAGLMIAILGAGAAIVAAITALIAGSLGTIGVAIAAAEGLLAGLATVMTLCMAPVFAFIKLADAVSKINDDRISKTIECMIAVVSGVGLVMGELAVIGGALAIGGGILVSVGIAAVGALLTVMTIASKLFAYINSNITQDTVKSVVEIITGKEGLIAGISKMITGLVKLCDFSLLKLPFVTDKLNSLFFTISKFIDIITKVATMNYISGYDENGRPIYSKLPPSVFANAATAVTDGFTDFILGIYDHLEQIETLANSTVSRFGYIMMPVLNAVAKFVDIVTKVATLTIVTGYDDKGNPIYELVDTSIFSKAATEVSKGFGTFILTLTDKFEAMKKLANYSILQFGYVMRPVMEAVSTFVDTVIKVATMTITTGFDKNGKPIYEQVDPSIFGEAAIYVAVSFGTFISQLTTSMKDLTPNTVNAIKQLGRSIGPIMEGVGSFVDSIVKLISLLIPDEWDKDGKPIHYKEVDSTVFGDAATAIATSFGTFIDEITNNFSLEGSGIFSDGKTEKALKALADSIGPVMEGVGTFTESILMLATGVYIEKYEKDKDGKYVPIYKPLTTKMFEKAANTIADQFGSFVDNLTGKFSNKAFLEKVKSLKDYMKDSILPIMESVNSFSKALEPFMKASNGKKDKDAALLCMQPGVIKRISDEIANSFVSFVYTIATELKKNEDLYDDAIDGANSVKQVIAAVQGAANSMSKIIKSLLSKDGKNILDGGVELAKSFTNVAVEFAKGMSTHTEDFSKSIEASKNAKNFLNVMTSVSKYLSNMLTYILKLNPEDSKALGGVAAVELFIKVLDNLSTGMLALQAKIVAIQMTVMTDYMDKCLTLALQLSLLAAEFMESQNITGGIEAFMHNMDVLASKALVDKMTTSGNTIIKYTSDLKNYTALVVVTTTSTNKYTISVTKANNALDKLDKSLITKDKQRTDALKHFNDGIKEINTSLELMDKDLKDMTESINNMNFDGLLEKFKGVGELLSTAVGSMKNIANISSTKKVEQSSETAKPSNNTTNATTGARGTSTNTTQSQSPQNRTGAKTNTQAKTTTTNNTTKKPTNNAQHSKPNVQHDRVTKEKQQALQNGAITRPFIFEFKNASPMFGNLTS